MAIAAIFVFSLLVALSSGTRYLPNWDSIDSRPLPKWYDQGKFGIFMHWGLYSVPSYGGGDVLQQPRGGEWIWNYWQQNMSYVVDFMKKNYPPGFEYPDFAPMFTAEFFDPDRWADLFKASGAQYVVLTSKHHEGFTNWQSKTSWNWNAVDTGPHRDLVGALADAIRNRTSIHFGLYFSLYEWYHPLYLQDKAAKFQTQFYQKEISSVQLQEIVNTYHPDVVWSDGDWEVSYTYWNSTGFLAWLYNESPVKDTVVVNDRWGIGTNCNHGGFITCTDRYEPGHLQKRKWENAMTVDGASWGFRREMTLDTVLTIEQLIGHLAKTVSLGGNLLLNVGPSHDGTIVPIFEERLRQIGSWLEINGEGIYNTTYWSHQNDTMNPDVWYTTAADGAVYAIVLKFPTNFKLMLGAVKVQVGTVVTLLGYPNEVLNWDMQSTSLVVDVPTLTPTSELKWAWTFKFVNVTPR